MVGWWRWRRFERGVEIEVEKVGRCLPSVVVKSVQIAHFAEG